MKHYLIILIGLILFISTDIILFNEETLILVCFGSFFLLISNNFKNLIYNYFNEQVLKIEKLIFNSVNQFILFFFKINKINKIKKSLRISFMGLKKYYLKFNNFVSFKLIDYQKLKKNNIFNNKLIFILQLEQQLLKLLILLFTEKLKKMVTVTNFFEKKLNIKLFSCLNKIRLRECIKNI